jgi:tetratricopeptide (TPR) repeat protein
MTETADRITPEMSEREIMGVILDEIMARAKPDVAEAIRFCAIPHWFNEEIIAWLRNEGLNPSQRSREILNALTELTFVGPYHERGWAYHENVRDLLLRLWRDRDGDGFKELSGRAASYFEQKLGKGRVPLAGFSAAVRRVWDKVETLPDDERGAYQREHMYHMLVVDQERGFKLFNELFEEAMNLHQLGECNLLKELAYEQRECLSLNNQRWLEFREGQLAFTSAQPEEAQRILEKLSTKDLPVALEGEVTFYLGLLHMYMGDLEKAERNLLQSTSYDERAVEMLEKLGDEHTMSTLFNNLGMVYQAKGEWDRAIEHYEHSLAIAKEVGDERGMAATLDNLGLVYKAKGEWDRAIEHYEHSLAIAKKVGDERGMAATFNNLGNVYQARGEWERAIEYYERSLAIKEKLGDEHGMAFSYNNIAKLYQDRGQLEEAISLFEKSLEIFERIGDKPNAGVVRKNLEKAKRELETNTGQA